jgi:uncharacterized protein YecE (DUF72 family)
MTDKRIIAGASGYSFKEWNGIFYPEKCKPAEMLPYYCERLPTVEINNTFYRMPKAEVLAGWAQCAPEHFRFAIKASRRITHMARLKPESVGDSVDYLYKALASLGDKRGPTLFQLPPNMKLNLARLDDFVTLLPADHRAAFEFRNEEWFEGSVYATLERIGASLVFSEREDGSAPALVETTDWGYVRLRLEQYTDADLEAWARRLEATGWKRIYVYFMHEPTAPEYARKLMEFAR